MRTRRPVGSRWFGFIKACERTTLSLETLGALGFAATSACTQVFTGVPRGVMQETAAGSSIVLACSQGAAQDVQPAGIA